MLRMSSIVGALVLLVVAGFLLAEHPRAQQAVALSGTVTSQEEGPMEGVVVSARRDGANATVSVVSDARGQFSFPRTHLSPGAYALTIRAVGYDLTTTGTVTVAANQSTTRNLVLQKTKDLASQLSSLEWVMSMPGSEEQKGKLVYQLLSCAYCHTYERILKSKHTAEEFVGTISRMSTYFNDGTALGRGNRGRMQKNSNTNPGANPNWFGGVTKAELGALLAAANLSGGRTTWPYELRTLPRPTGKATRVIMTQYDMPRADTVPHDLDVDATGTVWYPDQSRMFIGKFDPKTATFKEYPLPPLPQGRFGGVSDPQTDLQGRLWFPLTTAEGKSPFGAPTVFDPKTEKITTIDAPDDLQFLARGPDGKIWFNNTSTIVRVDPQAMKADATFTVNARTPGAPPGGHSLYQTGINSKGNVYAFDWLGSYIIGIEAATGRTQFWPTPTRNAAPRRGKMDDQDRLWFAEYTGDRIGVFDTRSEQMREWPVPHKYTTPYAASVPDKNGYVYTSSNMSERLLRLDPRTGEVIEYQIPTDFDSKEILLSPSTTNTTIWMANTRNARILKVEPLD